MFIGHHQWDTEALHALVGYVLDGALDARTLNTCTALTVKLEKTGMISIKDSGRGLPISITQIGRSIKQPAFLHVLTWFMPTGAGYNHYHHEHFGFLAYFALLLSCLSEHLKITTVWDQVLYTVSCSRGKITEPLQKIGTTSKRGTTIAFLPDGEVFSQPTFSRDKLISLLSQLSEKYPQIHIQFEDDSTDT